jgi:hypothetical protein
MGGSLIDANSRLPPDSMTYPGGWLAYGKIGIGRIKPENWRYIPD